MSVFTDWQWLRPEVWWFWPLGLTWCWWRWRVDTQALKGGLAHADDGFDQQLRPHVWETASQGGRPGPVGLASRAGGGRTWAWCLLWTMWVAALAGPSMPGQQTSTWRSQGTVVVLFEVSGEADPDFELRQHHLLEALDGLAGRSVALVVYGGGAYLAAPVSFDTATTRVLAEGLAPDIMPVSGSGPASAWQWLSSQADQHLPGPRWLWWWPQGAGAQALAAPNTLAVQSQARGERLLGVTTAQQLVDGGSPVVDAVLQGLAPNAATSLTTQTHGRRDWGEHLVLLTLPMLLALWGPALVTTSKGVMLPAVVLMLMLAVPVERVWADPGAPDRASASEQVNTLHVSDFWRDFRGALLLWSGNDAAAAQTFSQPHWRAMAWIRAGRPEEAIRIWRSLGDASAYYQLGTWEAMSGRWAEAKPLLERALALAPTHRDARHNLDVVMKALNSGKHSPPAPNSMGGAASQGQSTVQQEADELARQWLGQAPKAAVPMSLLKEKLKQMHQRDTSSTDRRP